ncbi:SusC/RagA family TonB-linked outer membrane protein [Sphingobacterium hungaricum]|uniref:TonB-dependent receptor n=1 Tax=Sphingobacterium hungaricum TaxID=2082723 RepID=A0A928V090_9SPHI|nr:TonB-dependent receptor [Sphingobacterium hungaricum]MBE8714092.1 TonB-dependent receptor [Sphingobacterium hungaricum]
MAFKRKNIVIDRIPFLIIPLSFILSVNTSFARETFSVVKVESAQNVIRGKVVNAAGVPISGITVTIKGSSTSTATDDSGQFELTLAQASSILVFSNIGYTTQEITVTNQQSITVTLQEKTEDLDEVVVIGYGSVKKKDLTGAISVVDPKEMAKTGSTTIGQSLQGLATGVNVRNTGVAGGDASIEIRGIGSLTNNNPLWVVDGLITSAGVDFNPADVESVQILKDASAAAIYGSRAANGVIIVTTKKGKEGPAKIDVNIRESFDWSPRYDLMNAQEFIKYNDMAYREGIKDGTWTGGLQDHLDYDTDWQEETMKTALVQDYNVGISGGSANGNYYLSGGYHNNDGIMYGNSFKRYSFRVNTEGKKGIFSFGENISIAHTDRDPLQTSSYIDVIRMLPTIPVYNENNPGGFGYGNASNARTFGTNPIAKENLEQANTKIYRLRGNFWGEIKITDFLKYRLNAGVDYIFDEYSYFRKEGNWSMNQEFRDATGSKNRIKDANHLIENTIDFNKDFGLHRIDAVLGMTYQEQYWEDVGAQRLKFPYLGGEYITVLNAGQTNQTNWNSIGQYGLISYLGRANYNYDDRYLATATFRRDGTSKLAEANRWDNFYSISGAWRISKEKFFKSTWVNDLKIRANYGQLGNAAIGNWDYLGTINPNIITIFGPDQSIVNGATQVRIVNEDLRWEKTEQINVGVDAVMLNNRLRLVGEYYRSTTSDVLAAMQISMTTGNQGGAPLANVASLRNTGIEISANWRDNINDLGYNIGANFTTVRNKILELGYGNDVYYTGQTRSEVGRSLGEYYLIKTDGLFRTQQDIDNYLTSTGQPIFIDGKRPQLGDMRYIDTDDNGQINPNDRQILGNPWPDFLLSLNVGLNYKNFDFSMLWSGQFGNDVLNGAMRQGRLFSDNSNYIRFESGQEPYQENPNSDFPRIIYGDTRNTKGDSDMWLEDGSYFRLRNFQLGYTVNSDLVKRLFINSVRIYVTGNNLLTFTKYKGLDPDFINTNVWDKGTDNMAFPNTRTIMAGLQFNF